MKLGSYQDFQLCAYVILESIPFVALKGSGGDLFGIQMSTMFV